MNRVNGYPPIANPSTYRCLVVADFNALNFSGYLANEEDAPPVHPLDAPFGQVVPLLSDFSLSPWPARPDFLVVWTRPEQMAPSFQRWLDHQPGSPDQVLAEVEQFAGLLLNAASHARWVFVPNWVMDAALRGAGLTDWLPGSGAAQMLARMNLHLADKLAGCANVFLFETQRWINQAGAGAFSDKLWYQGKIPFANLVFQAAAKDMKAALQGLGGQARKLLVVDLDDTLWGGVVGDVGLEDLKLGGHDAIGEAFADFQMALKSLSQRGVVLGIVSKNEEAVALGAIREHQEMRLKVEDFAGWRINWKDKANNLVDLAAELNLGLQSVVFIDDNPAERDRVREALPEVLVPEWPDNPMLFKRALLSLRCFDTPVVSAEDRQRAQAYAVERQRTEMKRHVGSTEDWLRSLHMMVRVEKLSAGNLPRAAQLLNKTNQMNLATRRLSEAELTAWAGVPGQSVWVFRVSDKLGDSGLTGLASLQMDGDSARVVDFVLSCRVMGRKIEEAMAQWLVMQARQAGARELVAEYLPTPKNKPCQEFWLRSGFQAQDGRIFRWHTGVKYALPDCLQLVADPAASTGSTSRVVLAPGQGTQLEGCATMKTIEEFITLTGDASPLHTDFDYARRSAYGGILVHGMVPVLFLSALDLVQQPGRRAVFRKISANFNQPIFPGDPLVLSARVHEYIPEVREASIEFQVSHRLTGRELTTGLATFVLEKISNDTSYFTAPGSGGPLMVCDPVKGEALEFDQIERGAEKSFGFQVNQASLRAYHEMLRGSLPDFDSDFDTWRWRCDVASLLTAALISTFVGQCIPGSHGTCRNFDLTFHQPLRQNRPYRFTGKVAFKSPSTSSVISQIAVDEPGVSGGLSLAAGKIHAGVTAPKASSP
jgi:FkbH-like protein